MVGVYCFEIRIFEKKMKTIYGYIMDYNTDHESDYESDYESVFDFSVKKCGICLNALNDFYNREHFMCTTCDESLEDALWQYYFDSLLIYVHKELFTDHKIKLIHEMTDPNSLNIIKSFLWFIKKMNL